MKAIDWLIKWYRDNCDGDWEHCYGIKIETCDNPGWIIDIDLKDTDLENIIFNKVQVDLNDDDWICCTVTDNVFRGSGSIDKFEEILVIFKEWVEENQI